MNLLKEELEKLYREKKRIERRIKEIEFNLSGARILASHENSLTRVFWGKRLKDMTTEEKRAYYRWRQQEKRKKQKAVQETLFDGGNI